MQFFEALHLVNAEIERHFDQSDMTTAALREATWDGWNRRRPGLSQAAAEL